MQILKLSLLHPKENMESELRIENTEFKLPKETNELTLSTCRHAQDG